MRTKDLFRLIKQAQALSENVIRHRTPDVGATMRKASRAFSAANSAAVEIGKGEILPESFTYPVRQIVEALAQVSGDVCTNINDVSKAIKPADFAAYVKEEIAKSLAADTVGGLGIAYSLRRRIDKAAKVFESFGQLPEEMDAFVFCREDAAEAASLKKSIEESTVGKTAEEAAELRKSAEIPTAWSGEGSASEADPFLTLAEVSASVEKSTTVIAGRGKDGWAGFGGDINSPEFLTGVSPDIDFGPDAIR